MIIFNIMAAEVISSVIRLDSFSSIFNLWST